MRTRALRHTLSTLALLAVVWPCSAWAERADVRAGLRGESARVVFEWPLPVAHVAELSGHTQDTVRVTFDHRLDTAPSALVSSLPGWLKAARLLPDGKGLLLELKHPARLRSFTSGNKVLIDLIPVVTVPLPEVSAATEKTHLATAALSPPAPETPEAPEASEAPETPGVPETPGGPDASEPPPSPPAAALPLPAPAAVGDVDNPTPLPTPAPPPRPAVAPRAPEAAAPSSPATLPAPDSSGPSATSPPTTLPTSALPAATLQVAKGAPLAVFRRGVSLFLVVSGKDAPSDLAALVGPDLAASPFARLLAAEGGKVVQLDLSAPATRGVTPDIAAGEHGWIVRFDATSAQPVTPLSVDVQADYALGPRLLVRGTVGNPVRFTDPMVGDTLVAVPVADLAHGVAEARHVPQADILSTQQGVAIAPLADGLNVVTSPMGVEISAAGGLKLAERLHPSPATASSDPLPSGAETDNNTPPLPPLFDFSAMGQPAGAAFTDERQKLQKALAEAPQPQRNAARIAVARFYFINGMPTEAAALWSLAANNAPDTYANAPEYTLMRAIAALSSGSVAEAEAALAALAQPTTDAALWQGVVATRKRDWAAAADYFRTGHARMKDYPEPYLTRLQTAAIETALNTGDKDTASVLLTSLTDRQRAFLHRLTPAADYLTGLLNWQQNRADEARAHFSSAAQSWDQLWRVRSELALIEADVREGKATDADALRRLERLRFAWRGDALEFDMLHQLGALYVKLGDYAAAFESFGRLATKFPSDPRTPGLAEEQRAAFTRIFQGEERDRTPAFSQLAIWDRYPSFRPTQPDVLNAIRLYLADRVAGIDLMDRAISLYQEVLAQVTQPVARAEMGTKIAALQLLNNQPEAALQLLRSPPPAGSADPAQSSRPLPETLKDERRILEARALFDTGKPDDALALLVNDYSDPAMRLRADITWRTKRWAEAAATLGALIGPAPATPATPTPATPTPTTPTSGAPDTPPSPPDATLSHLILNRAMALALAGDEAEMKKLRDGFGPLMAKTEDAAAFSILTRPESGAGLPNRTALMEKVAEVDLFQKFLKQYRAPPPASEPASPPSETPTPTPTPPPLASADKAEHATIP